MSRKHRSAAPTAIDELRSIRSSDPCASIAITTIKATIHTLETHWIRADSTADEPPHDDT